MHMVITGLGLISSIGRDVATSCASYRAGIRRTIELKHFHLTDPESYGSIYVSGHVIEGITDGFEGPGLLMRIACHALDDLFVQTGIDTADKHFFEDIGLFLSVSHVRDPYSDSYDRIIEESLLKNIVKQYALPVGEANMKTFFTGNAGVISSVKAASEAISSGEVKRVIILGIDSLIGEADIEYFASEKRLKTPLTANGLSPGEAAAAILVEDIETARQRNAAIRCFINSVNTGMEANNFYSDKNNDGNGLYNVLRQSLNGKESIASIYGDRNGESWRDIEFGNALMKTGQYCDLQNAVVHTPAECFGDTGAASGAVAICTATQSFVRNYAHCDDILVFSSSVTGEVGSALLSIKCENDK